jgi:hypothetical protein
MNQLTAKQIFLIIAVTVVLAWGIAVLVDKPWFRRFLALIGLMAREWIARINGLPTAKMARRLAQEFGWADLSVTFQCMTTVIVASHN